ncbi:MAG: GMC family oxidoreductase N-terminal domain-containing protein [Solirubrobacterales bacterium]
MSALGDFAAALLPPETGGPDPERTAAVARRMISRMPMAAQASLAGCLLTLEGLALLRTGRTLGALPAARREALIGALGRGPGATALDPIRSVVMLAEGSDRFAAEIAEVASMHELSNPDPVLDLIPAAEWPRTSSCDALVIGSGAGGAFAARALARAGLDTVIVEEGERWSGERIRDTHPIDRFSSIYRDAGTTMAFGRPPIPLPLGRAVGGTTVINSGTCYPPPTRVATAWYAAHGLALAEPEVLGSRVAEVEATILVAPAPLEVLGRNGELALAGAEALGWRAAPLRRNAPGCRGACQCAIGCPNNAKAGVHLNALPQACEAGARIISGLTVRRVLADRGRATGIEARAAGGEETLISAPIVVVAAGAVGTPPLLRRSGLGGHPRLGRGLSIHPATGITASFKEEVVPWRGVMQSVGIEELHEREGILIEATSTPPGMGAVSAAGYGAHLQRRLQRAANTATLGAMIGDAPSGRVLGARRPLVAYALTREDGRRLVTAVGAMARTMLAAGAIEVELAGGVPPVRDEAEIGPAIAGLDPRRLRLAAFHPTGSAAAGSDRARHPVGPDGRLRGVEGVWVADGSILPSCPEVNPQVSIMALASGVGEGAASG